MKLLEFCSLFRLLIFPGMVDPSLAEWRICLLDWVPMCRSLFPRVWYLDAVCFCWLHTSSRAWCLRQQSSYWSKFCLCSWLSPFFSCQLCVSFFPIKRGLCSHSWCKGKSKVAFTLCGFSSTWISISEVSFEGLMMGPSGVFLLYWLERQSCDQNSPLFVFCFGFWSKGVVF